MAENENDRQDNGLIIAEVRAYLVNGETIDLLPFKHANDVRSEINKFIEDWARTGFLLKENFMYPWHQVKTVEVLSVQALSSAQAGPFLEDWRLDSEAQQTFWKTRKPQKNEEKKEEPAHA
jgi:hypothetical protein